MRRDCNNTVRRSSTACLASLSLPSFISRRRWPWANGLTNTRHNFDVCFSCSWPQSSIRLHLFACSHACAGHVPGCSQTKPFTYNKRAFYISDRFVFKEHLSMCVWCQWIACNLIPWSLWLFAERDLNTPVQLTSQRWTPTRIMLNTTQAVTTLRLQSWQDL